MIRRPGHEILDETLPDASCIDCRFVVLRSVDSFGRTYQRGQASLIPRTEQKGLTLLLLRKRGIPRDVFSRVADREHGFICQIDHHLPPKNEKGCKPMLVYSLILGAMTTPSNGGVMEVSWRWA